MHSWLLNFLGGILLRNTTSRKKSNYDGSQKCECTKVSTLESSKTEATYKLERYWKQEVERFARLPEPEDCSEHR